MSFKSQVPSRRSPVLRANGGSKALRWVARGSGLLRQAV